MAFPKSRIISASKFVQVFKESAANKQRFCFILGSGASVDSGIPTGNDMEMRWMNELMYKDPSIVRIPTDHTTEKLDEDTIKLREDTRALADKLYEDDELTHRFSEIEKAWNEARKEKDGFLSSEYYFDLYKLRFHPNPQNGYRFLEQQMDGRDPSLGYRVLALLLTKMMKDGELKDSNQHNLVITTNFDSLTEDALFIYTDKKPLVISHESLAAFIDSDTQRPIVAKVHRGLMFDPFNSPETTDHLEKEWHEALDYAFKTYTPVVIGYGGGDGSLMTYLQNATSSKGIYWCYLDKYGLPGTAIQKFVRKRKGCLVAIEGFDELMNALGNTLYPTDTDPSITSKYLSNQSDQRAEKYLSRYLDLNPKYDTTPKNASDKEAALDNNDNQTNDKSLTYFDHINLAYTAAKKGDPDTAIIEYTNAIEKDPNRPIAYNNRGAAYARKKDYQQALIDYTKAIELDSAYAFAYGNRALAHYYLKEYDKSIADDTKAIELDPKYSGAYRNRGNSYAALEQHEQAIKDYDKAIELDPNNAAAYSNRGSSYDDLGQYERAIQDYDKAIGLDPNNAFAYNNRGVSYHNLKDYKQAIENYDKAIKLDPNYITAYRNRARSHRALGNIDLGEADEAKAAELEAAQK